MPTPSPNTAEPVSTPAPTPEQLRDPAPVGGAPSPPTLNLATMPQKIWLCVILTVLSFLVLWCTYRAIRDANDAALEEHAVSWVMPSGVHLRVGTANLRYDPEQERLLHRGQMDAAEQMRLRDLIDVDAPPQATSVSPAPAASASLGRTALAGSAPTSGSAFATPPQAASNASAPASSGLSGDVAKAYYAAINSLAYQSQASQAKQMQLLIWLGMLGGTLGALLRSFVDFVGNACYKSELDLVRWWPLYATRPVVGAILGLLLVVMFKAKLISGADTQIVSDSYWWLGMTALGGFSTIDVTARLRQAAKALFGGNE